MSWDIGLADRVEDRARAQRLTGLRAKNVFGGRGFLLGRSAFVIVFEDTLIVKCPPDEYPDALALPGVVPFAPDGARPMSTWVVVAGDAVAEDPALDDWVARGVRALREAPTKPARRSARRDK